MNPLLLLSLVLLAPWPLSDSGTSGKWPIPLSTNNSRWPTRQLEQGALQESVLTLADKRAPSLDLLQARGSAPSYGIVCYVWSMEGCEPCRLLAPHVERLHNEGWAIFKYDFKEHFDLARMHDVSLLPTIEIGRDDNAAGFVPIARFEGYRSYEELKEFLTANQVYGPKSTPTALRGYSRGTRYTNVRTGCSSCR